MLTLNKLVRTREMNIRENGRTSLSKAPDKEMIWCQLKRDYVYKEDVEAFTKNLYYKFKLSDVGLRTFVKMHNLPFSHVALHHRFKKLASSVGFDPTTSQLTAEHSTS